MDLQGQTRDQAPFQASSRQEAPRVALPSADGATPAMAQFLEIKAANPDSLLFYRMGDFYELFFSDAEEASRALGITLTKRGKHAGQDIAMCGVPVHAADDYLQKLIALGFRVAVCEQLEDPAEAKKRGSKAVVRRDVTRLVTPATITEEKLLDPSDTAWLACVARAKADGEIAIAAVDITSGAFRLFGSQQERLVSDLLRIAPREIICAQTLFDDPKLRAVWDSFGLMVHPLPATLFDSSQAPRRLASLYDVATMDSFGEYSRAELSAAAGVAAYIERTQIAERPSLQVPQRDTEASTLFIDGATRNNLELERTLSGKRDGSLYKVIDRTASAGGARLLLERLRAPSTDVATVDERLNAVSWLLANGELIDRLKARLKATPDMPRALSRLALNRGGPRDMQAIQNGIEAASQLYRDLSGSTVEGELTKALDILDQRLPGPLLEQLSQTLAEELPLLARDGGFVRRGFEEQLDELRALRDESRKVIAGLQTNYAHHTGVKSLKIKHNNVLGYFIEVTAQNAAALTEGDEAKALFIHRQTLANAMRFTTTELAGLESRIADAAGQALAIELDVFEKTRIAIVDQADNIRTVAHALAVIDVSAGFASLAQEQGYCRPIICSERQFKITGGRHPVVEQVMRRRAAAPFVANDCDLSPSDGMERGKLWLLTGPNMGGKSTFLRQNALIAIMAQTGSFVPAGAAQIGVVDKLFSRVGASDDLAQGRSTFMVEMVETSAILNQATDRSLVILDEIGRGTATYDGLAIAWATVEYLHGENKCRTLFATHFHELTSLSSKLENMRNVTIQVKEHDGDVVFLHTIADGSADRSYGLQVAKLAGLPHAVVARAKDVLAQLEQQGSGNKIDTLIDDLPLFSIAPPVSEAKRDGPQSALADAVSKLVPDDLSPREALEELYRLKGLLTNKTERL
ncbi:MAG: DNA mismatch repair protein MutS [Pseudomonadota bacterium]